MTDIAAFLLARVAEDEAPARAATSGRWVWTEPDTSSFPQGDVSLVADQGQWETCPHYCVWQGESNMHRGEQGKPGHEHRVTEPVVQAWGYDAWGITVSDSDAAHIARWDPQRVLAECAAKRALVGVVQSWMHARNFDDAYYSCPATVEEDVSDPYRDGDYPRGVKWGGGVEGSDLDETACNCGLESRRMLILRPLAQPFSAHPDFDPAWAAEVAG